MSALKFQGVANHDIVGASAGGVELFPGLAAEFLASLPASDLLVLHTAPEPYDLELACEESRKEAR